MSVPFTWKGTFNEELKIYGLKASPKHGICNRCFSYDAYKKKKVTKFFFERNRKFYSCIAKILTYIKTFWDLSIV